MRRLCGLIAIAYFSAISAHAAVGSEQSETASEQESSPAVAMAVEYAKQTGRTTLVYVELDDARPDGRPIVGSQVIQLPPELGVWVQPPREATLTFVGAIAEEAAASGEDGWRVMLIVIDNGEVSVRRGPRPGDIGDFGKRNAAAFDGVFKEFAEAQQAGAAE